MKHTQFCPRNKFLQKSIASAFEKDFPDCLVVIHHVTDRLNEVQFEIETRNKITGEIKFHRIIK